MYLTIAIVVIKYNSQIVVHYISYIENSYTILTCMLIKIRTLMLVATFEQEKQEKGILLD